MTPRAFNTISIHDGRVTKSSGDHAKMLAEFSWLAYVPNRLRPFVVNVESQREGKYCMQYVPNLTLHELFVHGCYLDEQFFEPCLDFLSICCSYTATFDVSPLTMYELVSRKTKDRLVDLRRHGFNIDQPVFYNRISCPSLSKILEQLEGMIDYHNDTLPAIMHGDFCFSNIFYDQKLNAIKVIDPRGYVVPGQPSLYGDLRYDLAKFAHSLIGCYDLIIADRYELIHDGDNYLLKFDSIPRHRELALAWGTKTVGGLRVWSEEIHAIMITLFISMIPLHYDRPDHQHAFIANALRLYLDLINGDT